MASITNINSDLGNSNIIITASEDTNAKVWDLRQKSNMNTLTFKEHHEKVNCL